MVFEVQLNQFIDGSGHQCSILVCHQSVVEHPQALVSPDSNEALGNLESLRDGDGESVVDTGEVTQVEDVMEL